MARDSEYELDEASQRVAFEIITRATLTHLIAEVAAINRSPSEAREFVDNLKSNLNKMNDKVNSNNTADDRAWHNKMKMHIDYLFRGIEFQGELK